MTAELPLVPEYRDMRQGEAREAQREVMDKDVLSGAPVWVQACPIDRAVINALPVPVPVGRAVLKRRRAAGGTAAPRAD